MLEKAAILKVFELLKSGEMLLKTEVINKKEDKRNKLLKTITGTDEKYREKVENSLLYLPKEQVEKYVETDKSMNPEDLVYGKHNFNRYGTITSFISELLTEVAIWPDKMKRLMTS